MFVGGWTLEAAQAVTGDGQLGEYEVFDLLDQLIHKSMVNAHPFAREKRATTCSRASANMPRTA